MTPCPAPPRSYPARQAGTSACWLLRQGRWAPCRDRSRVGMCDCCAHNISTACKLYKLCTRPSPSQPCRCIRVTYLPPAGGHQRAHAPAEALPSRRHGRLRRGRTPRPPRQPRACLWNGWVAAVQLSCAQVACSASHFIRFGSACCAWLLLSFTLIGSRRAGRRRRAAAAQGGRPSRSAHLGSAYRG